MENKPNVFPSQSAIEKANETGTKIAEQYNKEQGILPQKKSQGEIDAERKMKQDSLDMLEEQLKRRDELIAKKRALENGESYEDPYQLQETVNVTYNKIQDNVEHASLEVPEDKYEKLSRPQEDVPYDVIKLPSEGLIYPNQGSSIKIAYLNAMDENIITNPNLLKSGKWIEILINRKMIGTDLKYKDLHVGDRNAIMIWLRSTGYGPMYKIKLSDPENGYKEFEAEIDLSKLPIRNLKEKPDENGLFTLKLPVSGKTVKFRLLNVSDIDDIEAHVNKIAEELGPEFTDGTTYSLKKQIYSVDGSSDINEVVNFVEKGMRIGDVRALSNYVNELESGVDMNITVGTPGGGSIDTFLPLNTNFFWPDLGI